MKNLFDFGTCSSHGVIENELMLILLYVVFLWHIRGGEGVLIMQDGELGLRYSCFYGIIHLQMINIKLGST